NLGNLQRTVHLGLNPFQQAAFFQCRYELPQILERQSTTSYRLPPQNEADDKITQFIKQNHLGNIFTARKGEDFARSNNIAITISVGYMFNVLSKKKKKNEL
ncbi:MAG: hypothetical protein II620_00480, partial [Paludibacteraceae bacterium]|nr:hypothetical protein [Paludibacteraceae bacterium]